MSTETNKSGCPFSEVWNGHMIKGVQTIHETEIKQFGDRNDRNRVEIISTLSHKSQIVETNYEGRNRLRESKRIT